MREYVPIGGDLSQLGSVAFDLVRCASTTTADTVATDVDFLIVPESAADGSSWFLVVDEWLSVVGSHRSSLYLVYTTVLEFEHLALMDEGGAAILTENKGVLHGCFFLIILILLQDISISRFCSIRNQ